MISRGRGGGFDKTHRLTLTRVGHPYKQNLIYKLDHYDEITNSKCEKSRNSSILCKQRRQNNFVLAAFALGLRKILILTRYREQFSAKAASSPRDWQTAAQSRRTCSRRGPEKFKNKASSKRYPYVMSVEQRSKWTGFGEKKVFA